MRFTHNVVGIAEARRLALFRVVKPTSPIYRLQSHAARCTGSIRGWIHLGREGKVKASAIVEAYHIRCAPVEFDCSPDRPTRTSLAELIQAIKHWTVLAYVEFEHLLPMVCHVVG